MLLAALAATLAAGLAAAPGPEATPVPVPTARPAAAACATPRECFAAVAEKQSGIESMQADFRQTKRIALLREPLVSGGRFEYRRPDRVRWEVTDPEPLVIEIEGSAVQAGPPGRLEAVDAGAAASLFRDLGALFTSSGEYAGTRFEIGAGDAGPISFVLEARDPATARVLRAIELDADPATGVPRRAVLREANGDRTEIELRNVRFERRGGEPGGAAGDAPGHAAGGAAAGAAGARSDAPGPSGTPR